MKTFFYLSLTLAACRLSAQNPNPAWRHLPPDAAAIYHFNLAALTAKIPWYALASPIPAPQHNTDNRELVAILRNPDDAGVDVLHDLFIIGSNSKTDSCKTLSFLLRLQDSAKWSAFLRQQDPGLHILTRGDSVNGHLKAQYAGRSTMGAAWDNEFAILTYIRRSSQTSNKSQSTQPPQASETRRAAIRRSLTLLRGYNDSTCIRDSLFTTGFADDADIHAWSAFTRFHTLTSIRFEKGRITVSSLISLPGNADSLYARLISHPIPPTIISHLPPGPLLGLCYFRFDPTRIADLLTQLQLRGTLESRLFDKGLSLESFAHGFQGDFMLLATHCNDSHRKINIAFAASTLDLPAVRQWTNRLHPSGCTFHDSMLLIGNIPAATPTATTPTATTPTATGSTAVDLSPTPDSLFLISLRDTATPISGYIDCKVLAQCYKAMPFLSVLDKARFTAGRLNAAGQIETNIEITLNDPRAYSLQTIWPLLGP